MRSFDLTKVHRDKRKDVVVAYLEDHPCTKCGYADPRALDFHHREPMDKDFTVSFMVNKGMKLERILAEIEKCDVLCSNCHRIYHAEERGWFIDPERLLELQRRLDARATRKVYS